MVYVLLSNCVILWNDYRNIYGPYENPITVVLAIFSNMSYSEITSDNVRKNGVMINCCQVRGKVCNMNNRTEVRRSVMSVRRWHGGRVVTRSRTRLHGSTVVSQWRTRCTVAHWCLAGAPGGKVARWCHGGTPGVTVALWCHGGALGGPATRLRHVRGMWHGGTGWLVARWSDNSMARFPGHMTVKWWNGELAITKYME